LVWSFQHTAGRSCAMATWQLKSFPEDDGPNPADCCRRALTDPEGLSGTWGLGGWMD
jgi:hypothetical protein